MSIQYMYFTGYGIMQFEYCKLEQYILNSNES